MTETLFMACSETVALQEREEAEKEVGAGLAGLHSALSYLRDVQRRYPYRLAKDLGDLATAKDFLDCIVGDAEAAMK